jgi:hypothetical protein
VENDIGYNTCRHDKAQDRVPYFSYNLTTNALKKLKIFSFVEARMLKERKLFLSCMLVVLEVKVWAINKLESSH